MIIRKAKAADFSAIKKLIKIYPQQLIQSPLPKPADFFIAVKNGQIIAACALEIYSKRLAEVRSLVVEKAYQRRGVGTKLIQACLSRAKKLKIYEVLSITSAVRLFKKQGFKTFNREKYAMLKFVS